jgi:TrpR-related protein YerC/YecD
MISERQHRKLRWSKKKLVTKGGRGKYQVSQSDFERLAGVFVGIKNLNQSKNLLKDLMTERERADIIRRIHIAKLLMNGMTYNEINFITESSHITISRVHDIIKLGGDGLKDALEKIRYKA